MQQPLGQPVGTLSQRIALKPPCLCRSPFNNFKPVHPSRSPATVCQARGQSYHVEVTVNDDEDPEGVYKRFRNSCNLAGMVYEARRRQRFENRQDIKKRKQQEKGQKKIRDLREKYLVTYEEMHTDTPPFVDLFTGEDDMYDIGGEITPRGSRNFMSRDDMSELEDDDDDEERQQPSLHQPPARGSAKRDLAAATNGPRPNSQGGFEGRNTENFSRRSVASQGPAQRTETVDQTNTNGKAKPQVETARKRKAAKQQNVQESRPTVSAGVGSKPVKGGGKAKPKGKK